MPAQRKKTGATERVFNATRSEGLTINVRTPNVAGAGRSVDAAKYAAMKKVLLTVIPKKAPGFTQSEMMTAVGRAAPKGVFLRTTYMWWAKCVQLDLETRGELTREKVTPVRWHRSQ